MSRLERFKERIKEIASQTRTYIANLENPLKDRRIHFETAKVVQESRSRLTVFKFEKRLKEMMMISTSRSKWLFPLLAVLSAVLCQLPFVNIILMSLTALSVAIGIVRYVCTYSSIHTQVFRDM